MGMVILKLERNKFYCDKSPIFLKDAGIEKALVSNKISYDEKKTTLLVTYIMIIKLNHYI